METPKIQELTYFLRLLVESKTKSHTMYPLQSLNNVDFNSNTATSSRILIEEHDQNTF